MPKIDPKKIADAAAAMEIDCLMALSAVKAVGAGLPKANFEKLANENYDAVQKRAEEIVQG